MDTTQHPQEIFDIPYGKWLFAGPCDFVAGAHTIDQIPESPLIEVAFCGLSNVGKSSLINALTGRRTLARVSHTPGRTQQINFFKLREHITLVDLPGYGYANVSKQMSKQWGTLIHHYLKGRPNLRRVYLLIDSRRTVKESDLLIMKLLDEHAVSYQIILTKCDQVVQAEIPQIINTVKEQTKKCVAIHPEIITTSSKMLTHMDDLRAYIAQLISA